MPRLRRVPQAPAAAASARRRRQCVIYVIIGVIVLRTMGTEYSFLQDMNASLTTNAQVQSEYPNEAQHSYPSDPVSDDADADGEDGADPTNDLGNYSISVEPVNLCSDISKNSVMFDSCIRQSSKYTCQPKNSTDMDLSSAFETNCTSSDRTNPSLNGALRDILPKVLNDLNIKSIIRYDDGDDEASSNDWKIFPFWVQYFTIGTSDEMMTKKQTCFGNEHIHFHRFDLTCTIPPPADLIWVGDLSLTPAPIRNAILYHIQESGIQYLMTARLNATWFDNEHKKSISAPLYTSFDGPEQRLGVWKAPFVEKPKESPWDAQGGTDDGVDREYEGENERDEENDPEGGNDYETKSDDD